jgi:hypothetical protein
MNPMHNSQGNSMNWKIGTRKYSSRGMSLPPDTPILSVYEYFFRVVLLATIAKRDRLPDAAGLYIALQ